MADVARAPLGEATRREAARPPEGTVIMEFPGETDEYRAARDRLLERETELRRLTEAVAAERRALPPGGPVPEDYVFQGTAPDGSFTDVRMSELFAPGKDTLLIYSYMFPRYPADDRPGPSSGRTARLPLQEGPCPSCTALLDQLDGAIGHAEQRIGFAVAARVPLRLLLDAAGDRGWRRMRLLSAAGNDYSRDYHGELPDGSSRPMLNVFHRQGGEIRHFWGSELLEAPMDAGQESRHVDIVEPLWNLLDLTPEGRGDWDVELSYGPDGE